MGKTESYFAKPLPNLVRFVGAVKIVSSIYFKEQTRHLSIIFWLLYDYEKNELSDYHKWSLCNHKMGKEKAYRIREQFLEIYEDDELLVDFLNNKITKYYFAEKKRLTKTKSDIDANINQIMSNIDLFDFVSEI